MMRPRLLPHTMRSVTVCVFESSHLFGGLHNVASISDLALDPVIAAGHSLLYEFVRRSYGKLLRECKLRSLYVFNVLLLEC